MSLPQTHHDANTFPDAWDYEDRPAVRSNTSGWTNAATILVVEAFETLTTLGIAVNLVIYLTGTMHLGNATSANMVTNSLGTSFMLCLLGGFVADTFLGKYLTIAIFATVQAMGVTALTISTMVPSLQPPKCEKDIALQGSEKKKQRLPHSKQFRFLDKAAIKDSEMAVMNKWHLSTLTDVEEVKMVIRLLPIWATTVMFWSVQAQMTTFAVAQASTMQRKIKSFEIPSAAMTGFFVLSSLITVPIYNRFIIPILKRVLKSPYGLTPLQRIGVGLTLSILGMCGSALGEVKRLHVAITHGLTNNATTPVRSPCFGCCHSLSWWGSGEAFISVGQLDFFLKACPEGMKTMGTGLFLSTLSIGYFFSSVLVSIVHNVTGRKSWIADNLNEGRLHSFYWLLAVLNALNFLFFLICANWYVYKEKRLADEGIELEKSSEPICP